MKKKFQSLLLLLVFFSCRKENVITVPPKMDGELSGGVNAPVITTYHHEDKWSFTQFDSCTNEDMLTNMDVVTDLNTYTRNDTIYYLYTTYNKNTTAKGLTSGHKYYGIGGSIDVFRAVIVNGVQFIIGEETVLNYVSFVTVGLHNNLTSKAFYQFSSDANGIPTIDRESFKFGFCQ